MSNLGTIHRNVDKMIGGAVLIAAISAGIYGVKKTEQDFQDGIPGGHRGEIFKILEPLKDDFCNACATGAPLKEFLPERDKLMSQAGHDPREVQLICAELRDAALGQLRFMQNGKFVGQNNFCQPPTKEQEQQRQKAKNAGKLEREREEEKRLLEKARKTLNEYRQQRSKPKLVRR